MKIRTQMVSNSSSSSFVIGCKGPLTAGKILRAIAPGIESGTLAHEMMALVAKAFVENSEEFDVDNWKEERFDPYDEYYDDSEMGGSVKKIVESGMILYDGSFGTDSENPIVVLLSGFPIMHESDNLIIYSDGTF